MSDYQYAFKRLDKLRKTIERLVTLNQALSATNAQLRHNEQTFIQREAARERVLKSLTNETTISLENSG